MRRLFIASRLARVLSETQGQRTCSNVGWKTSTRGALEFAASFSNGVFASRRGFCSEPPPAKGSERTRRDASAEESTSRVIDPPSQGVVGLLWEAYTAIKASLGVLFVKRFVERTFDAQEFVSGARHAFFTVNDLFARQKVSELEPMLSRRVHEAFEKTLRDLKHDGLRMEFAIGQVHRVVLTGIHVQPEGQVRGMTLEEEADGDVHPPGWLTVGVRYDCTAHCKIIDAHGNTVSSTQDNRGHQWSFARMLPTKLPTEELQSPWRVVDVDIDALGT